MANQENASAFYSTLCSLVESREPVPQNCQWSHQDLAHIKLGLSLMQQREQYEFMNRYKDYQVIKALQNFQY